VGARAIISSNAARDAGSNFSFGAPANMARIDCMA
jgi:hypothetical protein